MAETEKRNPDVDEPLIEDEEEILETAVEAAVEADEKAHAGEAEAKAAVEDDNPQARIAELEDELTRTKDQLLRTMAEMENLRHRTRRDKEEATKYAPQKLVTDLLGVMDNLQRALTSVPAEAAEENEQLKTLLDGVEMTNREMLRVFERHNIKEVEAMGARLDPHSHEALFEVPDPNTPAGTIVQVIQPGFRLHDRLLRPARVGVAKGGPAASSGEKVDTTV